MLRDPAGGHFTLRAHLRRDESATPEITPDCSLAVSATKADPDYEREASAEDRRGCKSACGEAGREVDTSACSGTRHKSTYTGMHKRRFTQYLHTQYAHRKNEREREREREKERARERAHKREGECVLLG